MRNWFGGGMWGSWTAWQKSVGLDLGQLGFLKGNPSKKFTATPSQNSDQSATSSFDFEVLRFYFLINSYG
jgi:hypothetical protein